MLARRNPYCRRSAEIEIPKLCAGCPRISAAEAARCRVQIPSTILAPATRTCVTARFRSALNRPLVNQGSLPSGGHGNRARHHTGHNLGSGFAEASRRRTDCVCGSLGESCRASARRPCPPPTYPAARGAAMSTGRTGAITSRRDPEHPTDRAASCVRGAPRARLNHLPAPLHEPNQATTPNCRTTWPSWPGSEAAVPWVERLHHRWQR